MRVIKDCWASLGVSECQYGAHVFDGSKAMIYVNHWLAAFGGLDQFFCRKNSDGFVGHCLLVFLGVEKFNFIVNPYVREEGRVIWCNPINFNYSGAAQEGAFRYDLAGSLQGFASSVSIMVEAREFELHVLGENEPARQS
ncbi:MULTISPECIES: hypothetical protein [Ralstonia solanacearum species complex]|uniref:hypothetical protein n=1 Tax=Ralstonia solanacearum species complex TaxID=3116862 RepID=UPI000E569652|nr:hypothetical protein [Ralstonia solanacearum]AXV79848.1 hypothetical protein CJO76_23635 [Ralstonia solanacearum]AXV93882.1 hypothetical protein CJO79_23620 [Ralstonia solanacearum]AXW78776.1 hypothetical protein CJO97_23625 [Ralstonia solanacearum]BEU75077.1 hypothetical protein MAFF211271_46320 [Ralstonia pseudosolanacearum]